MGTIDRRTWLREALDTQPTPAPQDLFGMERHEFDAWVPDCERWIKTHCAADSRASQSVGSLHVDFCEWTMRNGSVPCRRDVFEKLLGRLGVPCEDGFTQGLILGANLKVMRESVTP
jgi:hypothetical protein